MPPRLLLAVTAATALEVVVGHIDTLTARGWEVDVVVGEHVDPALFPKATVHVLPMRAAPAPMRDARALNDWYSLLRRLQPDVVVGATPKASLLALTAARMVGVPHRVWWVWGMHDEHSTRRMLRTAVMAAGRSATVSVAASPSLAAKLELVGAAERPLVLGAGAIAGVDLDVFHPERPLPGPPTAIYVGRLAAEKGVAHLAPVWSQVRATHPNARLLVLGAEDPADPVGPALQDLLDLPGVEARGHYDDVPDAFREADVMIMPSEREGLPPVVLEAAACEVPTVGWDVTGLRDAVADGVTGTLVHVGDTTAMANAVCTLLDEPDTARRMGRAGRIYVEQNFERSMVEGQLADFLTGLVARSGRRRRRSPARIDLSTDVPNSTRPRN